MDYEKAACTTANPELFFPEGTKEQQGVATYKAKHICSGCTIAKQCLAEALANDEEGIWGGTTTNERKAMKKTITLTIK